MTEQPHGPLPIWDAVIPSTDVNLAIKKSSWRARRGLRIMAKEVPNIVPYILATSEPRPAIIVVPGGGYAGRAPHEGVPIARWLNSIDIASFVLNYRVSPFRFPVPFLDAQRSVRYIRHHATRFNVDPTRIGMLGFSAGGHLTSTVGTLQRREWFPPGYHADAIDAEPDNLACMVLCYAVINMDEHAHPGCLANILGRHPDPSIAPLLSTERQVSKATPPTFFWTTRDDQAVPLVHSALFTAALSQYRIEHELHVFEHGAHGLGLAENNPDVRQWTARCQAWLSRISFV